ncbi:1696_t:CDS:2 [Entrophospora sp. SA101]|nr:1696_t:CDS:2 [Entrophospora sp. SA101]
MNNFNNLLLLPDPHSRAEWLIEHYGSHALVYAIKFGPDFISVKLVECLLAKNINLSQYLVQKLSSNVDVYIHLLKKASSIWKSNLHLKGNDMQVFFYLSGGDLPIDKAKIKMNENLSKIEDLILTNKFVPFPQRPKQQINNIIKYQENLKLKSVEKNHHCLNDGYENNITSNIIPRAIILNPKLVTLWKNNGYKDIFHDYNDLVLKATYLMLFPPTIFNNNNNTNIPDLTKVVSRLREFVNLGFKLTKLVMGDVLLLFENELSMIGELILKSFQIFRNEDIQQILEYCLVQILMPEKGLKNLTILEFLYEKLENPEESFLKVLNKYNIGNQYCDCDCGRNHGDNSNRFIRLFSLNLSVYSWIFKKFESDSRVTSRCFDEILLARYYMDSQSILTHIKMEQDESLKTIFETFDKLCKQFFFSEIPYKTYHLKYLIKSDESVLLNRFFRKFIPNLFKIKKNSKTLIFNTELQVNWYEKLSKVKSNLEYYNDNNLFKSQFNQFGEKLSKMKILSELPPFSNCSSIKRPVNGESNFKQANKKKIKIT